MKASRKIGAVSNIFEIFIQDSSKTDGSGLTGLVYTSSGLTAYYKRDSGAAAVAITLADITTLGTFVSGGFKAVDGTNMPGVYEFHPPDACFASGAKSVVIMLKGATNMAPLLLEIQLDENTAKDIYDNMALASVCTAARLAELDAVNIPADVDTIKGYTDKIDDATDGLTAIKTQTNKIDAAATATPALATTGSLLDRIANKDVNKTYSQSTDSLEAISDKVALESGIETHVTNSLNTYDPPTRAEATLDKDAIITEVNANETKIDTMDTVVDAIKLQTDKLGFDASSYVNARIKAKDDIDFGTLEKASLNAATPASIAGDVAGKVLGGGLGTITGTGVRAVDSSGSAIAPAATALSNVTWTDQKAGYLDAAVSSRSSHSAADVWAAATRTLTSFGTLVSDIWLNTTRTLTGFGTLIADIWHHLTSSITTSGSIGKQIKDNLDVAVSTRSTPAQVNTEILDVLNTDTFDEPGQEAPPTPTTLVKKIGYLYKFMRNKLTATSTTITVYNDDGTTAGQKSTISDDGTTYTRGEFGSGA